MHLGSFESIQEGRVLSCFQNIPRAHRTDYMHAKHELIFNSNLPVPATVWHVPDNFGGRFSSLWMQLSDKLIFA